MFDAAYGMAGRFGYLDKYMLVASESRGDQSGGLKGRRRGRSLDWPAIRAATLVALWADVACWDGLESSHMQRKRVCIGNHATAVMKSRM